MSGILSATPLLSEGWLGAGGLPAAFTLMARMVPDQRTQWATHALCCCPREGKVQAFRALNLNLKIAGQKYGHCYRKFLITIYVPRSSKANKWWWIFLKTWILYFLELHSIWSFLWGVVGGGLKWITLAVKWVSYDGMGTKCLWKLTVLEKSYIDPIFSLQDMVTQKNTVSIVFSDF